MFTKSLSSLCIFILYLSCIQGSPLDATVVPLIPHATYPHSETFPEPQPLLPLAPKDYTDGPIGSYSSGIMLPLKEMLQSVIQLFKNIGNLVVSGVVLFAISGFITAALCILTPYCPFTDQGFSGMEVMDKEAMRSLLTPERLSTAAAMIQDAISRYDRLQRSSNSY